MMTKKSIGSYIQSNRVVELANNSTKVPEIVRWDRCYQIYLYYTIRNAVGSNSISGKVEICYSFSFCEPTSAADLIQP